MKALKTAAKWIGGVFAFLVFAGWAESGGVEPAAKWQIVALFAYLSFIWYSLSQEIGDLRKRVDLLIERDNKRTFPDSGM